MSSEVAADEALAAFEREEGIEFEEEAQASTLPFIVRCPGAPAQASVLSCAHGTPCRHPAGGTRSCEPRQSRGRPRTYCSQSQPCQPCAELQRQGQHLHQVTRVTDALPHQMPCAWGDAPPCLLDPASGIRHHARTRRKRAVHVHWHCRSAKESISSPPDAGRVSGAASDLR
jgi:hypothetical protein